MNTKLNIEKKFTLSGVIISMLMGIICVFLGFILDDIRGWRSEAMVLSKDISELVISQNKILDKQELSDKITKEIMLVNKRQDNKLDTITISLNGILIPMIYDHEGRIKKLEHHETDHK